MEVAKMNQGMFNKLEQYAQEVAVPLENRLGEIEKVIRELSEIRDKLKQIFKEGVAAQIEKYKKLFETSKNYENQLAKVVEGIESNLSNLI